MNNNRRRFLLYSIILSASQFLPGGLAEALNLDSRKSFFLVTFETFFPKPLSLSIYKKMKKKYMDLDALNILIKSFCNSGKILKHDTFTTSIGSKWIVLFDSKSSYYLWCYTVTIKNYIDEFETLSNGFMFENYGYYIAKVSSKKSIQLLISETKKTKAQPLYQTKTLNDISEYQKRSRV